MLNKINYKKISVFCLVLIAVLLPLSVSYALETGLKPTGDAAGLGNLTSLTISSILGMIAGAALALSGSVFLFLIVYGGMLILTSAGEDAKIKKGRAVITWAIIAVFILAAAYAITQTIFGIFTQK